MALTRIPRWWIKELLVAYSNIPNKCTKSCDGWKPEYRDSASDVDIPSHLVRKKRAHSGFARNSLQAADLKCPNQL